MTEHSSVQESSARAHIQWDLNIASAIPGWIMLSGGISSLLNVAWSFADDPYQKSFIGNWIPWIAVLFFVFGWLIAHGLEITLFQGQIKIARVLGISFLLGIVIVPWGLSQLIENSVFRDLNGLGFLIMSGYFFRFSMFHKRTLWLLPNMFFGKEQKS